VPTSFFFSHFDPRAFRTLFSNFGVFGKSADQFSAGKGRNFSFLILLVSTTGPSPPHHSQNTHPPQRPGPHTPPLGPPPPSPPPPFNYSLFVNRTIPSYPPPPPHRGPKNFSSLILAEHLMLAIFLPSIFQSPPSGSPLEYPPFPPLSLNPFLQIPPLDTSQYRVVTPFPPH